MKSFAMSKTKFISSKLNAGGACLTFHHYEKLDRSEPSDYSMNDANRFSLITHTPSLVEWCWQVIIFSDHSAAFIIHHSEFLFYGHKSLVTKK